MNSAVIARSQPVAVTGVGVKTPAGLTLEALWAALCEGRSSAQRFIDERLPADARVLVSRVEGFDPGVYLTAMEQRRFDRAHQLAIGAAQDAMDASGPDRPPAERCAVVC